MAISTSSYQKLLNLKDATFSLIDHEDAMVAAVYKITKRNGDQFILKISDRPNDYFREVLFLKQCAETLPVPKIIQLIDPVDGIHGAILMEYLPGTLLKAEDLTESLAYEIGCCLATMHLNRLRGYGDPIQDNLTSDPCPYFTLKFEEGLDECKPHLPMRLIQQCLDYYKANLDLLTIVDGPCVVHRDFRPGNIIVNKGKLQGIIDWAGARASFAEEDLCTLEHGEWSNNSHRIKSLLAGYANIRPVPDYMRLAPFLRLNKAIATIGFTVKRGTWANTASPLYKYNRQFLEEFFATRENIAESENGPKRYKQFRDVIEPNGRVDKPFETDIHTHVHLISSVKEKKKALDFRQKHFFDQRGFKDPYAWTLDERDHLHWLLSDGDKVIGYAHVQIWPEQRAALRIIVIDELKRGSGLGKYLMDCCEGELRKEGIILLQTEASPNAYFFYKKLGYKEMPFNDPDGEPTHPDDRAMGKYL